MATNYNEFRVGGFRILPPVIKNLLIINGLFFLATYALRNTIDLTDILGLHFFTAQKFHFYQFVTYMFMHGSPSHIFFNMFALWMFGSALENFWGSKRFLVYYFVTGIGAGIVQELTWTIQLWDILQPHIEIINLGGDNLMSKADFLDRLVTVGASGSVFGLLLAFGMMFPNALIYVYFLFPIKAKWFVIFYGVLELFSGVVGTNDGIAHFAHLGGMIFGIFLILYWRNNAKRKIKRMQQQYYFQN
jgi:membrane associated rhomboid family serine protease